MIKIYLKSFLYTSIILFISLFIITLLDYFSLFSSNTCNILKLITVIISIFVGAFLIGKNSLKKGYLEGIKYALIIISLIFIINIIFLRVININLLIYYIIILLSSIFGSMLGINFKKS